ncbi:MAG: methyltransferase domain-containing protein [Acidobacteriota bacterium]
MNERTFSHQRAHKLEDADRRTWLPPDELISRLSLDVGMAVADVGAGTGYFAFPAARAVAPGIVYALDSQPEMLEKIREKLSSDPLRNLLPVYGEAEQTRLPSATADRVLIANVWHELDRRERVLEEMRRTLRPGGFLAILDWRDDVERPPGPPHEHRVAMSAVVDLLVSRSWRVLSAEEFGMYNYLVLADPV